MGAVSLTALWKFCTEGRGSNRGGGRGGPLVLDSWQLCQSEPMFPSPVEVLLLWCCPPAWHLQHHPRHPQTPSPAGAGAAAQHSHGLAQCPLLAATFSPSRLGSQAPPGHCKEVAAPGRAAWGVGLQNNKGGRKHMLCSALAALRNLFHMMDRFQP